MGDGADMAIDHAFDDLEHYQRYEDAPLHVQYEEGLIDENGRTIGNPGSIPGPTATGSRRRHRADHVPYSATRLPKGHNKVCKFCGQGGLHWVDETISTRHSQNHRWRLYDGDERHQCGQQGIANKAAEGTGVHIEASGFTLPEKEVDMSLAVEAAKRAGIKID